LRNITREIRFFFIFLWPEFICHISEMILNRKRKSLFLLPWAMAVLLICIGSLINFHQHRIWHQPLLPQIVAHKKDVELTQTDIVLATIQLDKDKFHHHFAGLPGMIVNSVNDLLIPYSGFYHYSSLEIPDQQSMADSHGLRAPPLA
jgi:hypothetical protein